MYSLQDLNLHSKIRNLCFYPVEVREYIIPDPI